MKREICCHDKYRTREMAGFKDIYPQLTVQICEDCGEDISYLDLIK